MSQSKREQLLQAARPGQTLRYHELKQILEHFGFRLAIMNRLHNIFVHEALPELLNVQNINGQVKPFQVRQVIQLLYKYQLQAQDESTPPTEQTPKLGLDA